MSVVKSLYPIVFIFTLLLTAIIAQGQTCSFLPTDTESIGKIYYAGPNQLGDCLTDKPCTLTQAINKAQRDDHIVLKDGTYKGKFETKRDGVTIRAENRHKAILDGSQSSQPTLAIKHSDITVSGLTIDGAKKGRTLFVAVKGTPALSNIVIEHNMVVRSAASGIQVAVWGNNGPITNMVIRHNDIRDTGTYQNPGEGIYIGSAPGQSNRGLIRNVEIYGNTIDDFAHNGIDLKSNTENVRIHHNILKNQVYKKHHKKQGNEGTFAINGDSHSIYDNLLLNNDGGYMGAFYLTPTEGHQVFGNLIRDMKSRFALKTRTGAKGISSEVRDNIFCNIQNTGFDMQKTVNAKLLLISGNLGLSDKAEHAVCDERQAAILKEIKQLPSGPAKWKCSCESVFQVKRTVCPAGCIPDPATPPPPVEPPPDFKGLPTYGKNMVVEMSDEFNPKFAITTNSSIGNDMELAPSDGGYMFRVRGNQVARTYSLNIGSSDNVKVRFNRDVGSSGYAEVFVNGTKQINYRGSTAQNNTDLAMIMTSAINPNLMIGPGCQ